MSAQAERVSWSLRRSSSREKRKTAGRPARHVAAEEHRRAGRHVGQLGRVALDVEETLDPPRLEARLCE